MLVATEQTRDKKPVVLTVDDDPIILSAVLAALKDDYVVRPFPSGETALSFLKKSSVDIILLDHNMPEMTGLDVLEKLQSDPELKEIPVIFLTGSVSGEDEVTALENGAVDYLLKPFHPPALITRVRLQLELYRHRHHLEEMVQEKTEELRHINKKLEQRDRITLDLLAQASDLRDHDTGAHIDRTTAYTHVLVMDLVQNPKRGYEISEQYGQDIIDAVKLHDLGKLAMPDNVLLKPGRLNDEELAIIRTHPIRGAEMLRGTINKMEEDTLLLTALDITLGHHEKWDGTGYPRGTAGEDIPLCARIAAIADVFDALTSERPYKQAFTAEEAFAVIYRDSGTHFDPYLVEVLKRHEYEYAMISTSTATPEAIPEYL